MGCINTNPVIKVKSIKSFKKKLIKQIKQNESEDNSNTELNLSDFTIENTDNSSSEDKESKILINAQIENNELIFL